jgi:hypothetical protein
VAETVFWSTVRRPIGDPIEGWGQAIYGLCLFIIAALTCPLGGTLVGLIVGLLVNKFRGPKDPLDGKGWT